MTQDTRQETFAVTVSKTVQYQITADSREDAEHIAEQIVPMNGPDVVSAMTVRNGDDDDSGRPLVIDDV